MIIVNSCFVRLETPEEKLKRQMDKVPPDYHPGIHTKNITLPIYRSKQYIEMEIQDITYRGGTILDIKTEATTMFGFQTMYILIICELPIT